MTLSVHHASPDQPPPRAARFRVSFRLSMLAVSLVTVMVTAAAVHLPWTYISRANIADMAGQLNTEIIRGIGREIGRLFDATVATQESVQEVFRTETVLVGDRKRRDQFMFAVLRANEQFSWVSFGAPNGDFYGAQRRDDHSFRVAESLWDPVRNLATRREDYYVGDDQRIFLTQSKSKTNDYFSPGREWYQKAKANPGKHIWTDVYVFSQTGKPGINSAVTLEIEGEFAGVVSIAIELERISQYLRELKIARNGKAFIVNRQGQMIAFEEPDEVSKVSDKETGESALRRFDESHHPTLSLARAALEKHGLALDRVTKPTQFMYSPPGGREGAYFVTFAPTGQLDWIVATIIPEADFLTGVKDNLDRVIYMILAVVALMMALSMVVARVLFLNPLYRMIDQTRQIEKFDLEAAKPVHTRVTELDSLSVALQQMAQGLGSFRKYISTDLVRGLLAQGMKAQLGGERRTLTILFMDMAGFTTLTERLGHRMLPYLAVYLGSMSKVIMGRRGTIDKFIGDAVMAFWGAPNWNEDHAVDACRAALECIKVMEAQRAAWKAEGKPDLYCRIGLNTGRVVVGNIGSEERLDYTVMGDPVNLASRLEGMNKNYGTSIIIGHNTYEEAKYDIVARRLDQVHVKGRDEPVFVYELLDMADPEQDIVRPDWVLVYEAGLDAYFDHDWLKAMEHFKRTIALRGADEPSRLFIERCEAKLPRAIRDGSKEIDAAVA